MSKITRLVRIVFRDIALEQDDVLRIVNGSQDVDLNDIADEDREKLAREYYSRRVNNPGPDMESGLSRYVEHADWHSKMINGQKYAVESMSAEWLITRGRQEVNQRALESSDHRSEDWRFAYTNQVFTSFFKDELQRRISVGAFIPDGEQIELLIEMGIEINDLLVEQQISLEQEKPPEEQTVQELQTPIELEKNVEEEKDKEVK